MNYLFLIFLIPAYVYGASYNCDYEPKCLYISQEEDFLLTEKEIQDKCAEFRQFQECLDGWGKQCLNQQQLQLKRMALEKPLKLIKMMCTDSNYRREYLNEAESFKKIDGDWDKCTKELQDVTTKASKLNDLEEKKKAACCGIEKFDHCTKNVCNDKCTPGATKIVNDMVEMAKEVLSVGCSESIKKECQEEIAKNGSSKNVAFHVVYLIISSLFFGYFHEFL